MDLLKIDATKSSPEIILDKKKGLLEIMGQSYPEDAVKFYSPILEKIKDHFKESKHKFIVNIKLVYLNTSSLKCMMILFDILDSAFKKENDITINWRYDKGNEIAEECGKDFKEDMQVPFNLIEE
jgi:hypothetical protein